MVVSNISHYFGYNKTMEDKDSIPGGLEEEKPTFKEKLELFSQAMIFEYWATKGMDVEDAAELAGLGREFPKKLLEGLVNDTNEKIQEQKKQVSASKDDNPDR